jgi:glycogen debranching enzyme
VRTLSSAHPAYNPNSYQNGSVWPHDNGLIALGFRRYGFAREAAQIAHGLNTAAGFFLQHRLPELYAGLQREPTNFPVQYRGANVPQAWAAGSCFSLLQAIIGYQPDAPAGKLFIDPALPDWMPTMELSGLRLGDKTIDLSLWREGARTCWKVTKGDQRLVAQRAFASGPGRPDAVEEFIAMGREPA